MISESDTIPEEDYESPEYVARKKCLVTLISLESPIGTWDDKKTKRQVNDNFFSLEGEEIDVDLFNFQKYVQGITRSTHEWMKPEFELLRNPTLRRIDEFVNDLRSKANNYGSFMFLINSYLDKSPDTQGLAFQLHDGKLTIDEFINKMKLFSSMALKPKIFLVQADDRALLGPETFAKAGQTPEPKIILKKIPTDADRLVIVSTIPQGFSGPMQNTRTDSGSVVTRPEGDENTRASFLMQAFIEVLTEKPDKDLLPLTPSILGRIEQKIEAFKATYPDYRNREIELPLVMSTLTKKVFLSKLVQQQQTVMP